MENFGIWVEVIMVFVGGVGFAAYQIWATNRDQRRSREREEAAKKETVSNSKH